MKVASAQNTTIGNSNRRNPSFLSGGGGSGSFTNNVFDYPAYLPN